MTNNQRLVFFDCESTGTNTSTDRIFQFSASCEGQPDLNLYLNPVIPVPKEVLELTGRPDLNEFLADKPPFSAKADEILTYLNQGVLAGFGIINFDIPILWSEFYRAGKVWLLNDRPMLDAYQIFAKKERRNLEAAVKFYCGTELAGAHDAKNDVEASRGVLWNQKLRYPDLAAMTVRELSTFCAPDNRVDLEGKLVFDAQGRPCYNIGNAETKGVPVLDKPDFAEWMLKRDFHDQTKLVLRQILEKKDTKQGSLL